MKTLLIALLLTGCATTKPLDPIAENLPQHVTNCICFLKKADLYSYDVNWKNKSVLKDQVKMCKCTLEITNFDDVENPLDYIKPGTEFMGPTKLYPWDNDFRGSLKPVK